MFEFLKEVIFFLILINPVSKIVVVNMLPHKIHKFELEKLIFKSSIIAFFILVAFAYFGTFILSDLFQIRIEALAVAGGLILAIMGYKALDKGIFFSINRNKPLIDMAIVPLASPLIAGPATISATIYKATLINPTYIALVIVAASLVNFLIILWSTRLRNTHDKYNIMGALIRITGLFIMAMGVNMMMKGAYTFFIG